jgi:hypothetical protein
MNKIKKRIVHDVEHKIPNSYQWSLLSLLGSFFKIWLTVYDIHEKARLT